MSSMKQSHFMALKTVLGVAMIALVVTVAHAWTAPTGTAPSGNVPVPVNTGATAQTKTGDFSSLGNILALGSVSASKYVAALQFLFSPMAVLGCTNGLACILNASNTLGQDVLRAGGFNTSGYLTQGARINKDGNIALGKITTGQAFPSKGLFIGNILGQDFTAAFGKLGVSLSGSTGSAGRNALEVSVSNDNLTGTAGAVLQTNADKFSFFNTAGTDRVGLSAKKIQLTEGAAQGKVLTSDADGNASWGDSAGGDGYEFPFPIYTQSVGATDIITASCPQEYPIMLSAGGQCSSPSQIQEMYVAFVGNPTSPGNMQMRCTKADLGTSADGTTATARPVCAKPSSWTYQAPYQEAWHQVAKASTAQDYGKTCTAWLQGTQYDSNLTHVRSTDSQAISGYLLSTYKPQGTCAYEFNTEKFFTYYPGYNYGYRITTCGYMPSSWSASYARPVGSCTDTSVTSYTNMTPSNPPANPADVATVTAAPNFGTTYLSSGVTPSVTTTTEIFY